MTASMTSTSRSHVLATGTDAGIAVTIEPSLAHLGDLQIRLSGELDYCSGPTLAHALTGLWPPVPAHVPGQHHAEVVLDLHELTFLDSSGVCALEDGRRILLEAGWFVTVGRAQPHVQRLLRFAERSGWLIDGPLVPEVTAHAEQRARPLEVTPNAASSDK